MSHRLNDASNVRAADFKCKREKPLALCVHRADLPMKIRPRMSSVSHAQPGGLLLLTARRPVTIVNRAPLELHLVARRAPNVLNRSIRFVITNVVFGFIRCTQRVDVINRLLCMTKQDNARAIVCESCSIGKYGVFVRGKFVPPCLPCPTGLTCSGFALPVTDRQYWLYKR